MNRKTLPALAMLLTSVFLVSACGGSDDAASPTVPPVTEAPARPLVIAHRGASGYLPEHTLAGYELAIRMKADYIEPDLQLTRDGELVAMHDETLARTTDVATVFLPRNGGYKAADFTLAEIRRLTVKPVGTAADSYPGFTPGMADPFRVPTFQEVIAFARQQSVTAGRSIGIYPEAKQADPVMEDAILQALVTNGYAAAGSRVFIQSFSDATVRSLRDKQKLRGTKMPLVLLGAAVMENGVAKMGVMAGSAMNALPLGEVAGFADGIGVVINYDAYGYPVTKAFIDQAHAAGLKVHGWTFAKTEAIAARVEYLKYLDMGMDGVFSNYPDLAASARDSR